MEEGLLGIWGLEVVRSLVMTRNRTRSGYFGWREENVIGIEWVAGVEAGSCIRVHQSQIRMSLVRGRGRK